VQVLQRRLPLARFGQAGIEELPGSAAGLVQLLVLRRLLVGPLVRLDGDPHALGKAPDRLHKRDLFELHDERVDVPPLAAAEAVVHLLFGADGERGGLFGVEGAATDVILTPFFQGNVQANHIDDVIGITDLIDCRI